MAGLRAVALALLVTLGTLGGVALGATQTDPSVSLQSVNDTANYLGANGSDVARSGQSETSLDVGATVGANGGEVRSRFVRASLRQEYEDAESPAARRAVVRNGTERLADRVDSLERAEMAAIDGYASGELSEADLFRRLARIDAESRQRDETAAWLQDRADELRMDEQARRLSRLRIRLTALQGPVRAAVRDGLDGTNPARVHAETAGGSLVLATTSREDGGEYVYVREAYRPEIRDVADADRYGGRYDAAFEQFRQRYTWVHDGSEALQFSGFQIGTRGARLYGIEYTHDHGRLTSYLDGGSDLIVKETHSQRVDRIPTESRNVTNDDGDIRVFIETTYASGPLGVTVTDEATGEPLNATVSLDGERVGATRAGTAWAVAPRGETDVTVRYEGDRVTTNVTAT